MHLFVYLIFLFFIRFFSVIPFKVLYAFSDLLSFLFYHLVRYRRKIILQNLSKSFPDKGTKELHMLLKKIYRNLLDIVVESIKGLTMSQRDIVKRHRIMNPELLNSFFDNGKSIICVAAHYGNWEWGAFSAGIQLKHRIVALYKPLSNHYIENYMRIKRAKAKTTMATIFETSNTFEKYKDDVCAYMMVADQSPTNYDKAYWIQFLNRETACLHGPEKHARNNNLPVIYLDVQRQRRGFYEIQASLITENPTHFKEGEITRKYMDKLEQIIRIDPSNWLWSHRRWKRNKDQS